jgi:hypothetical protein
MKKRSPVVRISPLMLALLSIGIGPPQSLRAIRISNSEAVAASAAARHRLTHQLRR